MENLISQHQKIIETASKLFQRKGYSATGLNEIVTESGSAKGSLYYYFPEGKLQVAIEAVKFSGEKVNQRIIDLLHKEGEPVQIFQSIILDLKKRFKKDKTNFADISFSIIALESGGEIEILRETCEAIYKKRIQIFSERLILSGMSDLKAKSCANILQIMIEGAIVAVRTENTPKAFDEIMNVIPIILNTDVKA